MQTYICIIYRAVLCFKAVRGVTACLLFRDWYLFLVLMKLLTSSCLLFTADVDIPESAILSHMEMLVLKSHHHQSKEIHPYNSNGLGRSLYAQENKNWITDLTTQLSDDHRAALLGSLLSSDLQHWLVIKKSNQTMLKKVRFHTLSCFGWYYHIFFSNSNVALSHMFPTVTELHVYTVSVLKINNLETVFS